MLKYIVAVVFLAVVCAERRAVVTLSHGTATGNIYFSEVDGGIRITGTVSELAEGDHGFHVHVVGDLTNGCLSMLGHFNPRNVSHGGPEASVRHVGDLGNIVANATGIAAIDFVDKIITLDGENSIVGRGLVIHEKADDLGLGGAPDSATTGNAGSRVGCGVIGTLTESSAERTMTSLLPITMMGLFIFRRYL